jgi:4a-hydroxytetrahydrobiopterin dehydratase
MELSVAEGHMPLVPGWKLDYPHLRRRWSFADFLEALGFVGRVAEVAEQEGHHPDVHLTSYRELELVLYTHAIGGLSENDFVLARKIGEL